MNALLDGFWYVVLIAIAIPAIYGCSLSWRGEYGMYAFFATARVAFFCLVPCVVVGLLKLGRWFGQ